jgi:3-methyladenine DNA glycosylase AlkD
VNRKLIRAINAALAERADPKKAPQMQAYMKSEMPYLGVAAPALRAACKEIFPQHALNDAKDWSETCLELWRSAKHREARYAAIELTGQRPYSQYWDLDAMPMFEEMIVTGAWWDYVDAIATNRVGPILKKHPGPMKKAMRQWSKSKDMWKRRTSILCQNRFKEETDLELLYDCIEPSIGSNEFFLRKAIGWALRELAKTNPKEVVRFVSDNEERLSGLSKREALKTLEHSGPAGLSPRS